MCVPLCNGVQLFSPEYEQKDTHLTERIFLSSLSLISLFYQFIQPLIGNNQKTAER